MTSLRPVLFALLALPVFAVACGSSVGAEDDDGNPLECDGPAPSGGGGWCPPAWSCVDGEWVDTAGACPNPCPAEKPSTGVEAPCEAVGAVCTYFVEDQPCGEPAHDVEVICTAEYGWIEVGPRCEPPPECPTELPVHDGDCTGWEEAWFCSYSIDTACGIKPATAYCDTGSEVAVWVVELPESCPTCAALPDPGSCVATPGCRWLEPGCGEPQLPNAGCYPAEDCTQSSCDEGWYCDPVVVNPCWMSPCDACGGDAYVCQQAIDD